MNRSNPLLLLFLFFSFLHITGCDRLEPQIDETITIMPLGDSRVSGNRPSHESYRYHLWSLLRDNAWLFDFVGSNIDDANYPLTDNDFFDRDHEGTGGARTINILETVQELIPAIAPDVVLLGIGGNDLSNGDETVMTVSDNISLIIDILRQYNPEVTIFLEQIAPGRTDFMTDERWAAFQAFRDAVTEIVSAKSQSSSKVIPVNMGKGWTDAYLADPVHYNDEGALVVAERYFAAMREHFDR